MLKHQECPRCHAPNLTTEVFCFACGESLRPLPKRFHMRPTRIPWPLWLGLLVGLVVVALIASQVVAWLAGYQRHAALPSWYLPVAGAALLVAGQAAFFEARRIDQNWWQFKRAPELLLVQARQGDAVWVKGKLQCDSPLISPYVPHECVYYRYILREREEGQINWQTIDQGNECVDFQLVQAKDSLYVPSGDVLFDAPLYTEMMVDSLGNLQAKVWTLPVGMTASVCGRLAGEANRPRMDKLSEEIPVVVTWRMPKDYLAVVARRAKLAHVGGWTLTVLGALDLIGGVVHT